MFYYVSEIFDFPVVDISNNFPTNVRFMSNLEDTSH